MLSFNGNITLRKFVKIRKKHHHNNHLVPPHNKVLIGHVNINKKTWLRKEILKVYQK